MNREEAYTLVVSFDDSSESFCNGFECGILWHRLKTEEMGGEELPFPIRPENKSMIVKMARHFQYAVCFDERNDEYGNSWVYAAFSKEVPERRKPMLKVVE